MGGTQQTNTYKRVSKGNVVSNFANFDPLLACVVSLARTANRIKTNRPNLSGSLAPQIGLFSGEIWLQSSASQGQREPSLPDT